jgi:single-strand DNA-binding protein
MSINKAIITGNLTRDAELRTTPSGTSVLSIGVAVNDRRRNQHTGEWEDYANFVDCTLFGRRAESLAQYLKKGTKVAVEGRLHYSSWEDGNGNRRSKLDVTVDEIEFMSSGQRSQGGYGGSGSYQRKQPAQQQMNTNPYEDEDIPF